MSDILEKYHLVFTYNDGYTAVSSISPLLSYYINNASVSQATELINAVTYFSQAYATEDRDMILTRDFTVKRTRDGNVHIIYTNAENALGFPEAVFQLPANDLLAILENWRQLLLPYRLREVEVTNGQGVIDIISDDFVTALMIEKAVAANWPDCAGSIGEYYAVSREKYTRQQELTANLNQTLVSGTDSEVLAAVTVFLDLFANGKYRVLIGGIDIHSAEIANDLPTTYHELARDDEKFTYNFYDYGYGQTILFSRSLGTIDEARVDHYTEMIKNGGRPKIVLFTKSDNDNYFVIDGHHKLLAYQNLGITAPAVYIDNLENRESLPKGDMLTRIMGILNPAELMHILQEDSLGNAIGTYMDPGITAYIDRILIDRKSPGTRLLLMLHDGYHSADEATRSWTADRLAALGKNKNRGSEHYLYHRSAGPDKAYAFKPMYIETDADYELWKRIFLDDEPIPADHEKRQHDIGEKYRLQWMARHNRPAYTPPVIGPIAAPAPVFIPDTIIPAAERLHTGSTFEWKIIARVILVIIWAAAVIKGCSG